mmetsp:Transcript_11280/g.23086  ORF Transcript_11280/g.23086 Transcript_11280/m.23086 type:complete len:189 (-) Transcript_11280:1937-2503(-)
MAAWGSQFSTGDQGNREEFWRSGFQTCQNSSCQSRKQDPKPKTIRSEDVPAGCRMNGDGYGTTVFTCSECGWKTSFQYDDASEPYYYETRDFRDTPPIPRPPHPWDGVSVEEWYFRHNIDPRIRSKLRPYALSAVDLSEMTSPRLKALGLKLDEAQTMVQAIVETRRQLDNGTYHEKSSILPSSKPTT